MSSATLDITPKTRLADLLEHHPELEAALLGMSPAFAKLKNPVLRRTVGRVATLEQVARLGEIPVSDLVNRLRLEAGLEPGGADAGEAGTRPGQPPPWFAPERIAGRLDAGPLLDSGLEPVGPVMAALAPLPAGAIFELSAPIFPAPLIDLAARKEFRSWWRKDEAGRFLVYFCRPAKP